MREQAVQRSSLCIGALVATVIFLGASGAEAADVQSGTLAAGYAVGLNDKLSDMYGFNGTIALPFTEGGAADKLGIEFLGGYHRPTDGNFDIWNLGASAFATNQYGRVALNFMHHAFDNSELETYGAGGEWFVSPSLSLAMRGGGVVWSSKNGGYAGAQGTWYVSPDFSFSGTVDYWSAGYNQVSETFKAEWMPLKSAPVALYTGYQHVNSPGISDSVIFVGVKFYLGSSEADTLVEHQRHDSSGFISTSPKVEGLY